MPQQLYQMKVSYMQPLATHSIGNQLDLWYLTICGMAFVCNVKISPNINTNGFALVLARCDMSLRKEC